MEGGGAKWDLPQQASRIGAQGQVPRQLTVTSSIGSNANEWFSALFWLFACSVPDSNALDSPLLWESRARQTKSKAKPSALCSSISKVLTQMTDSSSIYTPQEEIDENEQLSGYSLMVEKTSLPALPGIFSSHDFYIL